MYPIWLVNYGKHCDPNTLTPASKMARLHSCLILLLVFSFSSKCSLLAGGRQRQADPCLSFYLSWLGFWQTWFLFLLAVVPDDNSFACFLLNSIPLLFSLLTLTFCFHVCYNLKVKLSPLPQEKVRVFNPGSPAGGTVLEGFVTFRSGVLLKAMAYWGWALRFSSVGSTSCSPLLPSHAADSLPSAPWWRYPFLSHKPKQILSFLSSSKESEGSYLLQVSRLFCQRMA